MSEASSRGSAASSSGSKGRGSRSSGRSSSTPTAGRSSSDTSRRRSGSRTCATSGPLQRREGSRHRRRPLGSLVRVRTDRSRATTPLRARGERPRPPHRERKKMGPGADRPSSRGPGRSGVRRGVGADVRSRVRGTPPSTAGLDRRLPARRCRPRDPRTGNAGGAATFSPTSGPAGALGGGNGPPLTPCRSAGNGVGRVRAATSSAGRSCAPSARSGSRPPRMPTRGRPETRPRDAGRAARSLMRATPSPTSSPSSRPRVRSMPPGSGAGRRTGPRPRTPGPGAVSRMSRRPRIPLGS
jgi:hypothetical protein